MLRVPGSEQVGGAVDDGGGGRMIDRVPFTLGQDGQGAVM